MGVPRPTSHLTVIYHENRHTQMTVLAFAMCRKLLLAQLH